jgi:hypothetical protein
MEAQSRSWKIGDKPGIQGFFDALAESNGFPKGHTSFDVGKNTLDDLPYQALTSDSPKTYTLALQGQTMPDFAAPMEAEKQPVQVDIIKQDFATTTNKGILLPTATNPISIAAEEFLKSGQTATVDQSLSDGKILPKSNIVSKIVTYKWYIIGGVMFLFGLFYLLKKKRR